MAKLQFLKQHSLAISYVDTIIVLLIAFILGAIMVAVYRITHRSLNYERSFLVTLIVTSPIVAIIMLLIQSNLALSLGMVGALSIIRFRSVIKDTRDMAYLFWSIAIGLAAGTGNYSVGLIMTLFVGLILLLLNFFQFGVARHNEYILILKSDNNLSQNKIEEEIKKFTKNFGLRSYELKDGSIEICYELKIKKMHSVETLCNNIKALNDNISISFLAPQLALPL